MPVPKLTRRQRDVFDFLSTHAAFSEGHASSPFGADTAVADNLAHLGVLNKNYSTKYGERYWIRGDDEPQTGSAPRAGFVVILHRDLTTPSGKKENFFLARARYDGKGSTFRALRRGWMQQLGLQPRDLLSSGGVELLDPAEALFRGDHVILDDGES